jgi:predicted O-methyltransferase YrrM
LALLQGRTHVIKEIYERSWKNHDFTNSISLGAANHVISIAKTKDEKYNDYSDAVRPEIASGFALAIDYIVKNNQVNKNFNYMEIGSARGMSMAFIGEYAKRNSLNFSGLSIDPYFDDGYYEGAQNPFNATFKINDYVAPINISHRDKALSLWADLGLNVEQKRITSSEFFKENFNSQYVGVMDLVYVDGLHKDLVPMLDSVMSFRMLKNNGLIILDDWHWETVLPLKQCLDLSCKKVYETWKIAIYEIPSCF